MENVFQCCRKMIMLIQKRMSTCNLKNEKFNTIDGMHAEIVKVMNSQVVLAIKNI